MKEKEESERRTCWEERSWEREKVNKGAEKRRKRGENRKGKMKE